MNKWTALDVIVLVALIAAAWFWLVVVWGL